ncbi:MAG: hypothetical protein K6V97_08395 [Actinomycetia bacterium]|nr:hypothetical protein [Actinomycetes bacterium]
MLTVVVMGTLSNGLSGAAWRKGGTQYRLNALIEAIETIGGEVAAIQFPNRTFGLTDIRYALTVRVPSKEIRDKVLALPRLPLRGWGFRADEWVKEAVARAETAPRKAVV